MTTVRLTKYISESDLEKYSDHVIPYGPIGEIVDTRTYLRWIPELNRRETALERWQRVINYNLSLVSDRHSYEWLRSEALLMLDKFANLKADVSGRTKWVGGTTSTINAPEGNFNCSFRIINDIKSFGEIFGLLMNGVGVGFRVFSSDINNLPFITNASIELNFENYEPLPKEMREEHTYVYNTESTLFVEVGDSKQGWIDALNYYLQVITDPLCQNSHITFNLNSVRPLGERIKGFGGTASGPEALRGILEDIHRIMGEIPFPSIKMRSIDCMDVICAIAKGVIAGSSRRSALISLFEQCDELMATAKLGLYTNPELAHKAYRSQSNNTACLTERPTLEEIQKLLYTCKTEGEPGFNNYSKMIEKRSDAAKKYRPDNPVEWYTNVGTNPCFAAGTMIFTSDGSYPIETLVGKSVSVFDGQKWVTIDNFRVTGNNQAVYKVTLASGQSVTATANHTFYLEDEIKTDLKSLKPGDRLLNLYNDCNNLYTVLSVEFSHVADNVYCCTVPTNNRFTLANGIIVGNCHEIILSGGKDGDSVSFCNLTTLPLPNFVFTVDNTNFIDMESLESSIRLNTRISMRQTCVEFDNEKWTETQSDERLLGVSMTGCQDMFSMMEWETGSVSANEFLETVRKWANDEADKYSKIIGIPRPLLVTTTKPEGTSSTIFGTSSGLHWDWSPYYIRRVRMTAKDALAQTLLKQGYKAYPELYDLEYIFTDKSLTAWDRIKMFDMFDSRDRLLYLSDCNTIVFEFPIKSNSYTTQSEVSALEQLESLKAFSVHYTDHMPSVTISVKDDEWDDVAHWIDKNWNDYITASFFPYYDASYPLLPLEAIPEDKYLELLAEIPNNCKTYLESGKVTFNVDHDLLTQIERSLDKSTDDDLGSDCEKGVCPIR